jgi:Ca2+-binding RTX toxin-like protein
MATFTISTAAGFSMEQLNLFDLFEQAGEVRSATQYRPQDDASNNTRFNGVGLTYSGAHPDTVLTGGTINSIQDVSGGATVFNLTGVSISAVTLFNFYFAADTEGALEFMLSGNDTLAGGAGDDVLVDLLGDNRFVGGLGADIMRGGLGKDTYVVDDAGDSIQDEESSLENAVESSISFIMPQFISTLTLTGAAAINGVGRGGPFGPLDDTMTGNNAANVLEGGSGNDVLNGLAGNDTLDGGAGNDKMDGGLGNDVYFVDSFSDTVIDTSGTADEIRTNLNFFLSSTPTIEKLTLIGGAIRGSGNDLNNTITGNQFNNTLNGGGAGNDLLIGGHGNDFLSDGNGDNEFSQGTNTYKGEQGDDRYRVETATDIVVELENEGYDTVVADRTYTLTANVERLFLDGFTDPFNGSGNLLNNALHGNFGDNTLNGLVGADIMRGGQGNDTYVADNIGDRAIEATNGQVAGIFGGDDLVQASVTFRLGAFVERLTLTGALAINGTGNDLANTIIGNTNANVIDGKQGADSMSGGAGNDTYFRDDFGDTITDSSGIDTVNVSHLGYTLEANLENLNLLGTNTIAGFGNTLNNVITGNVAANALEGNNGNDTLDGKGGSDTMIGGIGADKFQFTMLAGGGTDSIFDFTPGTDDIVVDASVFGGGLVAGGIAASLLVKAAAPVATLGAGIGQFLFDTDDGRLFWDANGTTAGGVVHFATLELFDPPGAPPPAIPALLFSDFVVIP